MDKRTIETQAIDVKCMEEGLRAYILRVYNYMALGLAVTGIVAYGISKSESALQIIFGTNLFWIVVLAPIGIVLFLSARIKDIKAGTAQMIFWVYSGLLGISLAPVFIVYTGSSISKVFFITAGMFTATSIFGYTTKRDLSGFGSFLFMGLVGIIIAMVINLFLQSSTIQFVTSMVSVLVFAGLTAHDTQAIKDLYLESDTEETQSKKAILGALHLYLDFVNLFLHLLSLLGDQ